MITGWAGMAAQPWSRRAAIVLLLLVTAFVYAPVRHYDFVRYDDPGYVVDHPLVRQGLSQAAVFRAFTTTTGGFWQPLTVLSHMLDRELFGFQPGAHHLVNLILHLANVLLLVTLLARTTRAFWASWLVAALFALHPLNVESVAWVAERKNLLSTFFWLICMLSYARYVKERSLRNYVAVAAGMAASLLCKPMGVTIPVTLLLLDGWPLGRCEEPRLRSSRLLVIEKLPLFALSAVFSLLAIFTQHAVGATDSGAGWTLSTRAAHVAGNYLHYVNKLIWPAHLAALYPRVSVSWGAGAWLAGLGVLAGFTVVAVLARRRVPALLTGWLWYVVTLLPVAGIVMVGYHSAADRFAYVPCIGLFIMAAWALREAGRDEGVLRDVILAGSLGVLVVLSVATRAQLVHWRNSTALFEQAVRNTRGNFVMHDNLGRELAAAGKLDEAVEQFGLALSAQPSYLDARMNMAIALLKTGQAEAALSELRTAEKLFPSNALVQCDLGLALASAGRRDEAAQHLESAVALQPNLAKARMALGFLLLEQSRPAEALPHLEAAARLAPDSEQVRRAVAEARRRVAASRQGL